MVFTLLLDKKYKNNNIQESRNKLKKRYEKNSYYLYKQIVTNFSLQKSKLQPKSFIKV